MMMKYSPFANSLVIQRTPNSFVVVQCHPVATQSLTLHMLAVAFASAALLTHRTPLADHTVMAARLEG